MRCLIMTAIYKSFNVNLKMGQKLTPHADDDVKFTWCNSIFSDSLKKKGT